jgi:hypothetical protein
VEEIPAGFATVRACVLATNFIYFPLMPIARMFCLKIILGLATGVLLSCSNGPVEYSADNPGGVLHYISTNRAEIFRNRVDHEAELEARGVEPPVGNASWRDFWLKMIEYWSGPEAGFGTQQEVTSFIAQQRRVRGLPPLGSHLNI